MKFLLVLSLFLCVTAAVPVEEPVKETLPAPEVAAEKVVEELMYEPKLEMEETMNQQVEELMAEEEEVIEGDMVVEGDSEGEGMLRDEVGPDLSHEPMFEDPEEVADDMVGETPQSRLSYCPDGWFKHDSRCFLFVSSPKSWFDAEEYCNSLGANLASVNNPREYRFLQQLTQTASQANAWLGGFYLQGRWMWIDRQGFYYTNWHIQSSTTSSPCLYLQSNYGWRNANCASSLRFICSSNPSNC